jgi:hypothetical protein
MLPVFAWYFCKYNRCMDWSLHDCLPGKHTNASCYCVHGLYGGKFSEKNG